MTADVEVLARALCREWGHDPDGPMYFSSAVSGGRKWQDYEGDARRLLVEQRAMAKIKPVEGHWAFGWYQVPANPVSSPGEAGGRQETAIGEVG